MNHLPFIMASYAVALAGTFGLTVWSWLDMRRAETDAERLTRR